MKFPRQIQNLIEAFERLPGIGPKSAERLTFYLTHVPEAELVKFSQAISGLKQGIFLCQICKNISEKEICDIDQDPGRDHSILCVVENPLDVFSLEKTGKFPGVYHVLHGVINPLANIGPDELYINDLIDRVKENKNDVKEIILALNPTMEGEATAMYITKLITGLPVYQSTSLPKITRMGVGIPIGGDLQYADETTLSRALEGRRSYD